MLTVKDLIDINYIPQEEEVSLELLKEFYEDYLCKNIYLYTLMDGSEIKLILRDSTEIFHISGIDHIYSGNPMDAGNLIKGIESKDITMDSLQRINPAAYKDYIDRIRGMFCLDTILKKCEYLWFPKGKINDSKINVRYLLIKGIDGKNLHLGIDTYKENRPYFARTFLVTEGSNAEKFIGKADEKLRVAKLIVKDKCTDDTLYTIDRKTAIDQADKFFKEIVDRWIEGEFQDIIYDYLKNCHINPSGERVKDFTNSKIRKEWISMLRKHIDGDLEIIRDNISILDPYWANKIVAESERKILKGYAENKIDNFFYIENK